jgi:nucleotide-binding universal stress UspA family protein
VHAYTVPPRPPTQLSAAYGLDIDAGFRQAGEDVVSRAAQFVRRTHPHLRVQQVVERGAAPGVLTEQSETSRLVVIGPDEARPWYVRLFESRVARHLANESSCPVLVVPDTWAAATQPEGVTLMLDAETTAHGPLRYAFEAAAHGDRNLRVVHLVPADGPYASTLNWHDMNRLIGSWQAIFPQVQIDVRSATGVADLASMDAEETTGLLVLGRPRTVGPIPGSSRSLARSVIEHADCPVAVVPPSYNL